MSVCEYEDVRTSAYASANLNASVRVAEQVWMNAREGARVHARVREALSSVREFTEVCVSVSEF